MTTANDPVLLDVARGVGDMVYESRVDRNDWANSREVTRRPRTVRERLGEVIGDRLLLPCRVDTNEALRPTYHAWAPAGYPNIGC
jgi:hypothetical protein